MAISVPSRSFQYTDINPFLGQGSLFVGNPVFVLDAVLTFTAAGFTSAAAGDIALLRLPPGPIKIRCDLSRIICPIGTATSDLDIGLAAFVKADGTTQALNGIAFADSLDVGGAAIDQTLPLPSAGSLNMNSRDGAVVVCSFDTANSPAAGSLILKLVYQRLEI